MSRQIIKEIDAERHGLLARLKVLDRARALLDPPEKKPAKKKRKPSRRGSALNKVDKGLSKTVLTLLQQQTPKPGYIGLKATDIVDVLQARGFIFTSKFPSRSVSGLLTIMHKKGSVDRTPRGEPRIYHYRAASKPAASSVPSEQPLAAASKSQQRRLEHQTGGEDSGLETRSQGHG